MTKRQQIQFYEALHKLRADEVEQLMTRIKRKRKNHQSTAADEASLRKAVIELMKLEIHIDNRRAA